MDEITMIAREELATVRNEQKNFTIYGYNEKQVLEMLGEETTQEEYAQAQLVTHDLCGRCKKASNCKKKEKQRFSIIRGLTICLVFENKMKEDIHHGDHMNPLFIDRS